MNTRVPHPRSFPTPDCFCQSSFRNTKQITYSSGLGTLQRSHERQQELCGTSGWEKLEAYWVWGIEAKEIILGNLDRVGQKGCVSASWRCWGEERDQKSRRKMLSTVVLSGGAWTTLYFFFMFFKVLPFSAWFCLLRCLNTSYFYFCKQNKSQLFLPHYKAN